LILALALGLGVLEELRKWLFCRKIRK